MSAFDVLHENLPDYFKSIKEYLQILRAHGYALDKLEANKKDIYNNFFIQTADTTTLSYYENLLGLVPNPGDAITYRRQRIIQQLSLVPQFDINWLHDKLVELYGKSGFSLSVNASQCEINIVVMSGSYNAVRLFYDFIWDVLPAHIAMSVNQNVNTNIPVGVYLGIVASSTKMSIIKGGD